MNQSYMIVLRDVTERPEAVAAVTVKLVGTNCDAIVAEAEELLNNKDSYEKMSKEINPYGDGYASERIVKKILEYFDK